MTRNQMNARRRYTSIKPTSNGYAVWFEVGCQHFLVRIVELKSEAKWTQNQLAIAIDNIIEENQP